MLLSNLPTVYLTRHKVYLHKLDGGEEGFEDAALSQHAQSPGLDPSAAQTRHGGVCCNPSAQEVPRMPVVPPLGRSRSEY